LGSAVFGLGALAGATARPAPPSPYNAPLGPHRRFAWVRASLEDAKAMKGALGGTVNDVVLTIVAGALRRHMLSRGWRVDGLELRAMIPVSVRGDEARGDTGNQVAAMMAPLPVGCADPATRFDLIHESMQDLKSSGQALGAQVLTELSGFAPATILTQAGRLTARQRPFNLVVTNVPGPQYPLYLQGYEMNDFFPMVPLARGQGLGVAIMSYHGRLNFGLLGDYDTLYDLDALAEHFEASIFELAEAARIELSPPVGVQSPSRNGGEPPRRRRRRERAPLN
jgi:WS/DGAT/MGAT family acyltransferase